MPRDGRARRGQTDRTRLFAAPHGSFVDLAGNVLGQIHHLVLQEHVQGFFGLCKRMTSDSAHRGHQSEIKETAGCERTC
jgi:hypothetical protein